MKLLLAGAAVALFFLPACTTDTAPSAADSDSPGAADERGEGIDESAAAGNGEVGSIYDLTTQTLDGRPADLGIYRDKVTLVVNVASACGYTPQYAGLQELHSELEGQGFAVLAFPSNDFGGQEPGSAEEIRSFCSDEYGVTFPMFTKSGVRAGADQSAVYAQLSAETGKLPNWNFCKYLVGKDGSVLGFFPSGVAPDDAELRARIDAAL